MSIADRLEALRLTNKPFPITAYLDILYKSQKECYKNYLEGARLLLDYLTDNGKIPLANNFFFAELTPSFIFQSYYLSELTTLLSGDTYGRKYKKYKDLIYSHLLKLEKVHTQ